jgi:hypothetical protein
LAANNCQQRGILAPILRQAFGFPLLALCVPLVGRFHRRLP